MDELRRYKDIVYKIIGAAMEVHSNLNYGLLEPVYQEALHRELMLNGIDNCREQLLQIFYKGVPLDKQYKMDMVVGDIVVELKSVTQIIPKHRAQLCNYLRLSKKPIGLLINFGEPKLVGERWAYDAQSNDCFLVNREMEPVCDANYNKLLYHDSGIDECAED